MKMKLKIKIKYKAFIYEYKPELNTIKVPAKIVNPIFPRNPLVIPAHAALQA